MQSILLFLLNRIIPARLFSRLIGHLARTKWPSFLLHPAMRLYASHFKVNLSEAEKPLEEYVSFTDFFTRHLKEGARTIAEGERTIISPVDGAVYASGRIEEDTVFVAKGYPYTLSELLDDAEAAKNFRNGSFITIYLSPRDYHRLHTPIAGKVHQFRYLPGKLLPVNPPSVEAFPKLFAQNERLTTYIESEYAGNIAYIKVGATNVGRISLSYREFFTNRWDFPKAETFPVEPPAQLETAGEIGVFEMGSTVIMLFEPNVQLLDLEEHQPVQLGQKIGEVIS